MTWDVNILWPNYLVGVFCFTNFITRKKGDSRNTRWKCEGYLFRALKRREKRFLSCCSFLLSALETGRVCVGPTSAILHDSFNLYLLGVIPQRALFFLFTSQIFIFTSLKRNIYIYINSNDFWEKKSDVIMNKTT